MSGPIPVCLSECPRAWLCQTCFLLPVCMSACLPMSGFIPVSCLHVSLPAYVRLYSFIHLFMYAYLPACLYWHCHGHFPIKTVNKKITLLTLMLSNLKTTFCLREANAANRRVIISSGTALKKDKEKPWNKKR
jgi:hypothetical protein